MEGCPGAIHLSNDGYAVEVLGSHLEILRLDRTEVYPQRGAAFTAQSTAPGSIFAAYASMAVSSGSTGDRGRDWEIPSTRPTAGSACA